MKSESHCALIIPALNEAETIGHVLTQISPGLFSQLFWDNRILSQLLAALSPAHSKSGMSEAPGLFGGDQ